MATQPVLQYAMSVVGRDSLLYVSSCYAFYVCKVCAKRQKRQKITEHEIGKVRSLAQKFPGVNPPPVPTLVDVVYNNDCYFFVPL
jgi:hypothetical protein